MAEAFGKVILLGEHTVVYGKRALVGAINLKTTATVRSVQGKASLSIPQWKIHFQLGDEPAEYKLIAKSLEVICQEMKVPSTGYEITLSPEIPAGSGLGSSAAQSVAIIRALGEYFGLSLDNEKISSLAFESEKVFHGNPSGVDNTCAAYGGVILFRRPQDIQRLSLSSPIRIVIGDTRGRPFTSQMVEALRERQAKRPHIYHPFFSQVEFLVEKGVEALRAGNLEELGEIMNFNHGVLSGFQLSSKALDELIWIARDRGALGAKLTGAGGGGCMIALAPGKEENIKEAMEKAGYKAYITLFGCES